MPPKKNDGNKGKASGKSKGGGDDGDKGKGSEKKGGTSVKVRKLLFSQSNVNLNFS